MFEVGAEGKDINIYQKAIWKLYHHWKSDVLLVKGNCPINTQANVIVRIKTKFAGV